MIRAKERRVESIKSELDAIENTLKGLRVRTHIAPMFRGADLSLEDALKQFANTSHLNAIRKSLEKSTAINEEAQQWLEDACASLDEFTCYVDKLTESLYARRDALGGELEEWESGRSNESDNEEEGRSYDRQRV